VSATELIDAGKAMLPVSHLCQLLDIPRSSYYERRKRPPSRRALRNAVLAVYVAAVHYRSKRRYGSPRIVRALRKQGICVSKKRVARLMREQRLVARPKRRFVVTTDSDHEYPVAPNLVARNFVADAPNQLWVGDITYVWTREGWMYLAVLIDVYSRRVVGWAMRPSLSRELAIEALRRALELRRPAPGLVHHTDRGCQYASRDYRRLLAGAGITTSMSRSGNCLDNAMAESFFATLEHELLRDHLFESRSEALQAVAEYLENFYNRERMHSALDYASPIEYELAQQQPNAA
jgi:transposase InsO family protein